MNTLEAIDIRKSRRSYLDTPIANDKITVLKTFIDQYNDEGRVAIRFVADGKEAFKGFGKSYGMFKGVRSLIAMIGKKTDVHLKEKSGYYGELLILEATKLDLGTCWVGGTFKNEDNFLEVKEDEELVCVITVGNVQKESLKEKLIHGIATRRPKSINDIYISDCPVSEWFLSAMEAVLKAPSANNRKAVMFQYLEGEVIALVNNVTKFDLVDLGIAKAHFKIVANGHFEWGNGGKFIKTMHSRRI